MAALQKGRLNVLLFLKLLSTLVAKVILSGVLLQRAKSYVIKCHGVVFKVQFSKGIHAHGQGTRRDAKQDLATPRPSSRWLWDRDFLAPYCSQSPGFVHHQLAAVNHRALLHIWKAKRLFWPTLHYFFRGSRSFYWFCIFFVIDFLIYLFFAKKVSTWFTSKRRLLSSPHFFTQLVAYPPCGQNAGVPKKQCLCAHSQKWDPKTTSVLCLIALRAQLALYHSPGRSMWVL